MQHLLARLDQLHHAHGSPVDGMSPPHSSQSLRSTLCTYSALSECKLQPIQHLSAHSKVEGKLGNRWFCSDPPRQVRRAQTRGSYKNNSSVLCSSRAPIGQLWIKATLLDRHCFLQLGIINQLSCLHGKEVSTPLLPLLLSLRLFASLLIYFS